MNINIIPHIHKRQSQVSNISNASKVINFAMANQYYNKKGNTLFTVKCNSTKNKLLSPNDMNVISFIERRDIRQTVLQKTKRNNALQIR